MCRIAKSFLVTEVERKHARRRARFQQHRDASCHQLFFPARQGVEGNSCHSKRNIRGTCTIVFHRQKLGGPVKCGDISTCDAPRPGWPKTVTTQEIIDQIHGLIMEDRRTSAKSIAEQLDISRERVGSIIPEDLNMRNLSAKWVPKCLNVDKKKSQRCSLLSNFWNFFGAMQMISCRDWWPWTNPGYITMSRRQTTN